MWHVDAEIISILFMIPIVFDIFKTNTVKNLRNRLFNALSIATICAVLSDILSSMAMMQYTTTSWWLIQISLLFYFILTPLLCVLWQLYAISVVKKLSNFWNKLFLISILPFFAFIALVLSNPFTGWLFTLSPAKEYGRGVFFNIIFLVFYGYSFATLLLACVNFKRIERTTSVILVTFPVIVGIGVFLQQLLPGYLITGATFTLVLFVTYLFLQNKKATRDSLTGINNRLSFSMAIDKLSHGNEHGFVLTIAIDDFKLFNQTFGQKKGDLLLCQLAEYSVGISPNKTAYRYGGDIFVILLRKSEEQEAVALANAIMERFSQSFTIETINYSVSACLGVVEYPNTSADKDHSIITAIDFATYQAKKRGKGQIAFFKEELVRQFKRKHEIANAINRAIANNSFEVYIQPIYHMEKKKFLFGEALLRLHDEKMGALSPGEFVPIAEETGQIVEITYVVLRKVCAFLRENRAILQDKVSISVNFSVIQFMQNDMAEKVKEIIESYQIPPYLIKIEITESVIADSFEHIKTMMNQLSNLGISFALDDYGQGYSNISYLINLPFTFVKLDKSIIDNISTDRKFISALIPMFKSLDKIIISEGVETKEQSIILDMLSCDAIQGYYFAKPIPMEQSLKIFQTNQTP